MDPKKLQAVLLDFGGVVATEGFVEGLRAIVRRQGLDPDALCDQATEQVYATGYVVGRGTESDFWDAMRRRAGVTGSNAELTREILGRFHLRPRLLRTVDVLREAGLAVALLSDQTDWLDRLESRHGFFHHFDRILNSYHLGRGKRDPALFDQAVAILGVSPQQAPFVDDRRGNVDRAASRGLHTLLFSDEDSALSALERQTGCRMMANRHHGPASGTAT